jgi:hypothetical protein
MPCVPKLTVGFLLAMFIAGCGRSPSVEPTHSENSIDSTSNSQAATNDANAVLATALAQAGTSGKNVLVHLGAPW